MKCIIYSLSGLLLILSSCLLSSCEELELSPTSQNLVGSWYLTETTQIITCKSDSSLDTTLIFNDTLNTVYTLKKDGSWFITLDKDTTVMGIWTVNDNTLNLHGIYTKTGAAWFWLNEGLIQKLTSKQLILNQGREMQLRESANSDPKSVWMNQTTKFTKL